MIKKISIAVCIFTIVTCLGLMIGKNIYESSQSPVDIAIERTKDIPQESNKKEYKTSSVIIENVYADEIGMGNKSSQMTTADYSNFDTIIDDLIDATE